MVERFPNTTEFRKCSVLGVGINATSYAEVASLCQLWIDERRSWKTGPRTGRAPKGRYICATSVHGVMTALQNRTVRMLLNDSDIATPDGMPIVWALRSFGVRYQKRVYGPQLMLNLCEQATLHGHRIYLYGSREDTISDLCRRLVDQFPKLIIAGVYSPPFRALTAEEDAAVVGRILESDSDIVFVGISTPKQERWMWEHRAKLPGVVMVGVGAAFDFHAGRVRQAPPWMQQSGLEWFFRLLMEPRRLWKRYLTVTPFFLPLWALQKLGILKYGYHPRPEIQQENNLCGHSQEY